MLPVYEEGQLYSEDVNEEELPGLTWRLDEKTHMIVGKIDGLDAIKQSIYCMLRTERFEYEIYSNDYGVELIDLFGQPFSFVQMDIEETIKETLTQDDRIEDVADFTFNENPYGLGVSFVVKTGIGKISIEWEVSANELEV